MSQRQVLVTGAGGFVGAYLAQLIPETLCSEADLLLSGMSPPAYPHRNFQRLDVTDREQVCAAVAASRPTHVIHLAGVASPTVAAADPATAWAVHVTGTLNLARALMRYTPDALLVLASSGLVYGATARKRVALTERDLLAPLDDYSASKAAADLALGAMAEHGLRCVRLRPFNHIGPGQPSNFVLPAFARQIARIRAGLGPPVIKVGNLSVQRDFLDVRDVARAYVATLQRTLEPGTILNVASGRLHSIGELLQRLIDLSGLKIRIEQDPTLMRPNDLPVLLGDASAARDALGWTPVHDCFQTLEALLSYWMDAVQNSDSSAHPKCPPR